MPDRLFPVLQTGRDEYERRRRYGEPKLPPYPRAVPWALLAPHERQARLNHDQTLERLAERGGLSPVEMLAIVNGDNPFRASSPYRRMPDEAAILKLDELVAAHIGEPQP